MSLFWRIRTKLLCLRRLVHEAADDQMSRKQRRTKTVLYLRPIKYRMSDETVQRHNPNGEQKCLRHLCNVEVFELNMYK